jgi:hypothetical protein
MFKEKRGWGGSKITAYFLEKGGGGVIYLELFSWTIIV